MSQVNAEVVQAALSSILEGLMDSGEAEALYPFNGGDPDTIIALRSAYRAGVDREGRAALRAAAATQTGERA